MTYDEITAKLTDRVSVQLDALHLSTGMSKTDIVNRAITLYAFYEEVAEDGRQIAVYDPRVETFELVDVRTVGTPPPDWPRD